MIEVVRVSRHDAMFDGTAPLAMPAAIMGGTFAHARGADRMLAQGGRQIASTSAPERGSFFATTGLQLFCICRSKIISQRRNGARHGQEHTVVPGVLDARACQRHTGSRGERDLLR